MKPPNYEALFALVCKIIAEAYDDAEREFYDLPWETHPPLRVKLLSPPFPKRKRGRPPHTFADRDIDPMKVAAAEVEPIADILRAHCPKQRGIIGLAIDIAADRAGIDREALRSYRYNSRHAPPIKRKRKGRWK